MSHQHCYAWYQGLMLRFQISLQVLSVFVWDINQHVFLKHTLKMDMSHKPHPTFENVAKYECNAFVFPSPQ